MGIKTKKYILAKDLVIPKGTVFSSIPVGSKTQYYSDDFIEATIGLTKDTYGTVVYSIDKSIDNDELKELESYFIEEISE